MLLKYFLRSPKSLLKCINRHRYNVCCDLSPEPPFPTLTCCLANGLRIATEESNAAMASVGLFVEAGARYETRCNNGITHFIEHMAYKGFMSMNKCAFEDFAYKLGVKFSARATRDVFSLTADCLPESTDKVINVFAKFLTELEVSEYNVDLERKNIRLELIDADNDPKSVLFDYLHATAFQGTPLAQRVIGPTCNIQTFNRDTVTNYMREQFQPWRSVLAVSGGVSHRDVMCKAEAAFGNIQAMPVPEPTYGPYRYTGSEVLYRDDSLPFAHVAIAVEAPGYGSKEYLSLLVASHIIGSWNKSQGGGEKNAFRLAQAAATHDLCESFESFYIAYKDTALWGVYFVSKKTDLEDMVYNIQDNWMNLAVTTVDADVRRGVNSLKLNMARDVCGASNSCRDMGEQVLRSCQRKSLLERFKEMCAIDCVSVKTVADKYIYDQCPVVAGVGPVENLPEYTRTRAGMYWLRF